MAQERIVAFPTEESFDINPPSREIPLADTNIHPLRKQLFQLRTEPSQFPLGNTAGLLFTLVPPTAAAAALALRFIKLVTVILNAQVIGRCTKPVIVGGDLLFRNVGVRDTFGERDTWPYARDDSTINLERLQGQFLDVSAGVGLLRVNLGSKPSYTDNFFGGTDNDTFAECACTSSAAGSVDVGIRCTRRVVVNDTINALDVETTGRNVGGN